MGQVYTSTMESYTNATKLEEQMGVQNRPFELLNLIQDIEDLESENGKKKFNRYFSELKTLGGDSEDNSGLRIKLIMPWEECVANQENQKLVKEFCFELSKTGEMLLQREVDELKYEFNFDKTFYAYQAVMMMK
jgi:hypothetical protein